MKKICIAYMDVVIFILESKKKYISTIVDLDPYGSGVMVEFNDDLCWLGKSDIVGYTYKSRLC
jgi:tRNA G26 N,N-dimethylase Trm1